MASAKQNSAVSCARDLLGDKISKPKQHSLYNRQESNSYSVSPSADAEKVHDIEIGSQVTVGVFRDGICLVPKGSDACEAVEDLSLWSGVRTATNNGGSKESTRINLTSLGASVHDFHPGDKVVVSVREKGVFVEPIDMEELFG